LSGGLPSREDGFALFEVLVAFTIGALALAFAFRAIEQSAAAVRLSEERMIATSYAETAMALSVAGAEEAAEGRFDEKFSWRITRTFIPASDSSAGTFRLVRLQVTIDWLTAGKKQTLSLSTLRLQGVQ